MASVGLLRDRHVSNRIADTVYVIDIPKSVLLFLPQVKISLDDFPNMLGLFICELGEIQLLACCGARHNCEFDACELADCLVLGYLWIIKNYNKSFANKTTLSYQSALIVLREEYVMRSLHPC